MTNEKKSVNETQNPEPAANENAAEQAPQTEEQQAAERIEADPVEALKAENSELRDKLLRIIAEMENLRKRTEREVRDAQQYAVTGFARDLLSVGDNMRRAVESVGEDARKEAGPSLVSLLEGVEMTERELLNVFGRHGIKRLEPQGERFDPHLHQAIFEVQDESVPAGTVVQIMQSGFTIGDRVLRPAMVGVSKGGPKPGTSAATDEAAGEVSAGSKVDRIA